ncbi:glutathione-disulfide reductase [Ketogulonicigenium vulgare]|uniref:Pyridine nucleotide-disulfide oxidoreductase dimerization protein n=1 Tax=Ketogulonicigenium vulgare (strain WSH-001) TaxID=759362 RepID=F9Y9U4_KETVW|nr:glutathione-disulfide reductase [Ketogulonicigenium vulgare]AEM40196.1 pyridine nucleotide-disulfide oxidoreductase dimerization protein [Ketogulonicigenium vulgare WSH-001]ALJ80399.1 NADPH-glutathione reductase [Ketogulonicigenium vulgare]ANW33229.1 glutathione-disulfide reductase [Ketogulonicigenium vulgare]AOZ53898.1 pyridine nucleotide-disulfide oxidoreductase dimerization protein [Ketogulonicigenium vulgare]
MAYDYDLFVIGGGSGGVRAARMAAAAGARVALAEDDRMGGTCVIRGCVPKKLMVYASSFAELPLEAAAFGWEFGEGTFDWARFRTSLNAELDRLEGVYERLLSGSGVTTYKARGAIAGPNEVRLSSGESFTAGHILIATGGRPQRPEMQNAGLGLVSDDVFALPNLPGRMLIIGGGYVASEFAGVFNGFGTRVTQAYRGAQILRGFDGEARDHVAAGMQRRGIDLRLNTEIAAMGPAGNPDQPAPEGYRGPIAVRFSDGREEEFDTVLFATGRNPNTRDLGLSAVGITLGARGEVPVDQYSQTSVPSIYAVGDVTDRAALTPVAIREAMCFVDTVFRGTPTAMDHSLVATAVFTQPEIGTVGLSEEDARARGPIEVYATTFKPMRSAFAGGEERVLMKLVVDQATRKVLGVHIVAPEAGEMIQLAAIAVTMGATKEDFDRTVAVHPTMAEELVTLRNVTRM